MTRCLPQSLLALGLCATLTVLVACEQSGGSEDVLPSEPQSEMDKVCGRSYGGMDGDRKKKMQALTEEQQALVTPLPSKADFVKMCSALDDEALARCLDPNWFTVNGEECNEGFGKLDEAKQKEIMGMLAGKPAEEETPVAEGAEGEAKDPAGGAGAAVKDLAQ
ncbi:MAG: hypothetical protein ACI9VR_001980 [Cognaticolwellia sp.]|jgi:hypothetical protein